MKNPHAKALGKLGGKAGTGKAKARTTEQARKAVSQRWKQWRENGKLVGRPKKLKCRKKGKRHGH
jgi:hypothetical protein